MDIGEQSLAAEFAGVEQVVQAHASEFAARGFVPTSVTERATSSVIRSIVFQFTNDLADLCLRVSFFVGQSRQRRGFTAFLVKPDGGRLDVEDYLQRHGRSDISALLTLDGPPTDLRTFTESAIRALLSVLDDELKPVVDGKTFEETPIDWDGYK